MRKFFLPKLFCLLFVLAAGQAIAQEQKATWGSDVIVSPTAGRYYKNARVSVGYDGTIFVGRLWATSANGQYQNWEVLKSVDSGHTFTMVTNSNVSGSVQYRALDIIAAGANATDFKLFVARSTHDTGTANNGRSELYLTSYDANGGYLASLIYDVDTYVNGYYRSWESLSLSSDWKEPNGVSAPYELDLVGAKAQSYDSIVVWASKDAGTTLVRRGIYGAPGYIKHVSGSIGSSIPSSTFYGRLGIAWDEFNAYAQKWGKVYVRFVFPDDATDPALNASLYQVGTSDSSYRSPSIVLSQQTGTVVGPGDSDIRTVVLYETNAVTGNYTSVNFRAADSLTLHSFNLAVNGTVKLGTASGGVMHPHAVYDPAYNNYMITYYDSATQALVYSLKPLSSALLGTPSVFKANYRDASSDLDASAYPRVDINNVIHQAAFVWNDNYKTMFDAEYALPTSVQSIPLNVTDVQVFPNPATDLVNVAFIAQQEDKIVISVYDITGRRVIASQATVNAGVNKLPVDINTLPTGNYIIQLKGNRVNFNVRITKEQ